MAQVIEIKFRWNLGNVVQTPMTTGVITAMKVDPGGISYFIENNVSGIKSRYWHEKFLNDIEDKKEGEQ